VKLRARAALLMVLAAGALFTGAEAAYSLRPREDSRLPKEVYASFAVRADAAEYVIRDSGGYVAVFERARDRQPVSVTGIELKSLREADRAMIEAGIPVISRHELLQLLEDLGS